MSKHIHGSHSRNHIVPLLNPMETAKYLGVSESWLAKRRMLATRRLGPPFLKMGALVRYRQTELDAWLEKHTISGIL